MNKEDRTLYKVIFLAIFIYITFIIFQGIRISSIDYIQMDKIDLDVVKPTFVLIISIPLIAVFFNTVPAWFLFRVTVWIQLPKVSIVIKEKYNIQKGYNYLFVNRYSVSKLQVVRC